MTHGIVGLTLNYRDAARTSRCISSLLEQEVNAVLIWDNSEDDGISARELSQHWSGDPRIHVRVSPRNLGFSAGVNQGLGEIGLAWPNAWVLLINNDAILLPGTLRALCELLIAKEKAIVAYPAIDHGGHLIGTAYYQRHLGLITASPTPAAVAYASGCTLLIATDRASLPLLDEDFFMYGEDMMLGKTLGKSQMVYLAQTGAQHEGSASSGMGSAFYESRMVAAHWLLARKLSSGYLDHALLLLGRAGSLTARAAIRSLRYKSMRPLWALWAGARLALGDDPALRASRSAVAELNAARQSQPAPLPTPNPPSPR